MTTTLPHHDDRLYLTDSGLETTLIFHDGIDLPEFAAFPLLETSGGRRRLDAYFDAHLDVARRHGTGFVLESVTWRANPDWGTVLGYSADALADANREAIAHLREVRDRHPDLADRIVISGCVGPRGDGYVADDAMTAEEAAGYHRVQIAALADGGAELVTALTMTSPAEATGVVSAAVDVGIPVVISFTVETDGRLPSGDTLVDAIDAVDAATGSAAEYVMINCAHPTHFIDAVDIAHPALTRVRGLRANASTMSHAELDAADELDSGDPDDLGARYAAALDVLGELTVLGGCCGTDIRHIEAIGRSCAPRFPRG